MIKKKNETYSTRALRPQAHPVYVPGPCCSSACVCPTQGEISWSHRGKEQNGKATQWWRERDRFPGSGLRKCTHELSHHPIHSLLHAGKQNSLCHVILNHPRRIKRLLILVGTVFAETSWCSLRYLGSWVLYFLLGCSGNNQTTRNNCRSPVETRRVRQKLLTRLPCFSVAAAGHLVNLAMSLRVC